MVRPTRGDSDFDFRRTRGDQQGPTIPGASPAAAIRNRVLAVAAFIEDPATQQAFEELISSLHHVFRGIEGRIGRLDTTAGDYGTLVAHSSTDLVIETGAVTLPLRESGGSIFELEADTEGSASSDILDTVYGGCEGDLLIIRAANEDRTVVLNNSSGTSPQLINSAGSDFDLDSSGDVAVYCRSASDWLMISSSNNSLPVSAAANLTTSSSSADATSYTSASIAPTGNRLVLAWVDSGVAGATPNAPTLSGNGLTWVQVATNHYDSVGAQDNRLTLFRAMGASPSSGAVTIDFSRQTHFACAWSIVELSDVDTSGSHGAGAIVQSVTASVNSTSISAALAGFVDTKNRPAMGVGSQTADAITPKSGFTELGESQSSGARIESAWKSDGVDTAPSASWSSSARAGAIAVEIKQGS